MGQLEVRVEHVVTRSPADVWAFVVDGFFVNHGKWDPAVTVCRSLDGGQAPAVGTRGEEVRVFGGKQRAEFEVTELQAQRRFAFENRTGPFELARCYTFEPDGSGTRLAFRFVMAPKGPMKLVFPLFRRTIEKQVRANINRLVLLLDGGSTH